MKQRRRMQLRSANEVAAALNDSPVKHACQGGGPRAVVVPTTTFKRYSPVVELPTAVRVLPDHGPRIVGIAADCDPRTRVKLLGREEHER
jgi:hypothetical protein